ncbi:hypothetical protein [Actinoallomurus soli]|uniref:hypothetical protein n=1 Tax=Actinoallomurus soli TaxID=2952535 RepID=UPI002093D931|nr:hypothetical protein [Actinoallomurus soli]MCO5967962.1 hypothetical protein [Actinoallomurus soli]
MSSPSILDVRTPVRSRPPAVRPRRRPSWPLLVLAGWLAQVGIRYALTGGNGVPVAFPDESGYLLAARWLTGGPGGDLSGSTFYQGGYPLLISPAFWLGHDPQTCYRIVLGINALVGASIFPLGVVALRRMRLARPQAYALAFGAALLPAATVFGGFALTDAVLPTLLLGWLLALHSFLRAWSRGRNTSGDARRMYARRTVAAGSLAGLAAAYAYTTHARGSVVLAVHVLTLAAVLGRDLVRKGTPRAAVPAEPGRPRAAVVAERGRPRAAVRPLLVPAAVVLLAVGAGWALNGAVRSALYPHGVRNLGGLLSTRLTTVAGLEWAVCGAAGQIWYLIVATWGLAGIGLVAAARTLCRPWSAPADRILSGVLLAATAGTALASSAALPDEHRVGNYFYGRYLACLAVAHALCGLAVLIRRRHALAGYACAAGVVLVGAGLSAAVFAGDRLTHYTFIAFDFPETCFLTWDWTSFRLGASSLAAFGLLSALVVLAFLPRPAWTIAAGLTAFNLVAALVIAKPWLPAREPIFRPGPPYGGVAVDAGLTWRVWVRQTYQVWWTQIGFFHSANEAPPTGTCMVIVPVPERTAPGASWRRHPDGWRLAYSGVSPAPWAAWRSSRCSKTVT